MDLNTEIREFKSSFAEGNILTRILLVMGFFLTLSSLAELSGKIVKWKGFILDGLNLYNLLFVQPILLVSSHIGFSYTELEIHTATVSSICIAIGMRVQMMGQKVAFQKISERYGNEVNPNLMSFWLIGVFAPVGLWILYGLKNPSVNVWWLIFVAMFLPFFMTIPKVIISKFNEHVFYERGSFSYFKSYYLYIASLLLVLCVLAAINSGISQNLDEPIKSIQPTEIATTDRGATNTKSNPNQH